VCSFLFEGNCLFVWIVMCFFLKRLKQARQDCVE
jgi:two-component system chemotaxis response regulator CheY